jgi:nucleoside-diphosphate-sugar epimerase
MRFLILGGTAWVGGELARAALAAGHEVTCLARGTKVPAGVRLVRADRDREDCLAGVSGQAWDAVFDVATEPGHVRRAVRDLEPVAARYLLVSTCSVYASQAELGADESAPRFAALIADAMACGDDYGPAKVACEDAVSTAFGPDRSLIARAGLIGGPGDPTGRTDYWPWRFAHPAAPGRVLAADVPDLPTAIIDVRDLATWLVWCAGNGTSGVFNASGRSVPFSVHLDAAREAARSAATVVAASPEWLLSHEVRQWSGPRSLPLWLAERSWYGMNGRSIERALAAGLTLRPLVETLRDALDWRSSELSAQRREAGLTDEYERSLLAEFGSG